jgi:hypothetical protein
MPLPEFKYVEFPKDIRISDPLDHAVLVPPGNHMLLGQKYDKGSTDALIYLGKGIEKNLYNVNVWLDVSKPHVVYVVGKRGEGKSYDLGVISEGLSLTHESKVSTLARPQTLLLFDTQSQFWTLGHSPDSKLKDDSRQLTSLGKWGLDAHPLRDLQVFVPKGDELVLPNTREYVIDPAEMDSEDWCGLLGVEPFSPPGHLLTTAYKKVTRDGYHLFRIDADGTILEDKRIEPKPNYEIDDLIRCIRYDENIASEYQQSTVRAVAWRLEASKEYPMFGKPGVSLSEVVRDGFATVFLLRNLSDEMKALVVGTLVKKLFRALGTKRQLERVAERLPENESSQITEKADRMQLPRSLWVLIDEAHVMCPPDKNTAAKRPLIEFVRRGRDAGLSLVMATQQPSAVDTRVLQTDLTIVHRITTDEDASAARARLPSPYPDDVKVSGKSISDMKALIRGLSVGEALCADAETDRAFVLQIRPRLTAHGGGEPSIA